jgi:DNA-binding FadR family transcriptional regulator
MSLSPPTLRVPKTAELVATELRRRIIIGLLKEGDALPPEASLMETFGVSRPTLREAFRVLESEGLIDVRRGSRGGARVRLPSGDVVARYAGLVLEHAQVTIGDVATARGIVECECVATIARRASADDVARLRAAIDRAEDTADPAGQLDAQHGFHSLIVGLAGNDTIELVHGVIQTIFDRADRTRQSEATGVAEHARHLGARAHRRLVDLLAAGDVEGAVASWRRHVEEAAEYLARSGGSSRLLDLL